MSAGRLSSFLPFLLGALLNWVSGGKSGGGEGEEGRRDLMLVFLAGLSIDACRSVRMQDFEPFSVLSGLSKVPEEQQEVC